MKVITVFDDFVMNRSDNTKRVFKMPDWKPDCIYTDPYCPRGLLGTGAAAAPDGGIIVPYLSVPGITEPWDDEHMCGFLAYSEDGLHLRPYREAFPGKNVPHMLGQMSEGLGMYPYRDPNEADPDRIYKSPAQRYGFVNGRLTEDKAYLLTSPDMVHWTRYNDAPVIPSYVDCYLSMLYNPFTASYQMTTRRRWGERRICLTESKDLNEWSFPHAVVHPLPTDEPTTHLYSMPHYYYAPGDLFVGLLWKQVMPFGCISDGTVVSEYAYSYDGLIWNRTNSKLFPEVPRGEYGAGSSYVVGMVDRGEDVLFYVNACLNEHGGIPGDWHEGMRPRSAIIPGILKKNRFVCIDSGRGRAELITQQLRLKEPSLTINANVPYGSLRAELLSGSTPVEGFGLDDFIPFSGDRTDAPLVWKGNLQTLVESRKWVKLHIVFEQAEVYTVCGDFDFTINTRGPAYDRL